MGKLSRDATDEGAESDITQIGAHSSVAYGAYLPASLATNLRFVPILGKATLAVLFA